MPFQNLRDRCLHTLLTHIPEEMRSGVQIRYEKQASVLLNGLQRLYRHIFADEAAFTHWLEQLMQSLAAAICARPAALRQLDEARSRHPDWFTSQNMLGYCAYADRFAGDLQGVISRIPHLRELGVTYLHLLPFLKARAGENDGGFAVADFDEIAPHLGSMQDLQELTSHLRAAGISLCSDFILNHVADDHAWARAAREGDAHYKNYFYHYPDRRQPDLFEQTLGQVFPQVAPGNFSFVPDLQEWVWTTFYPYQWDLNYTNPAVFADMASALLQLANRGVEVFRLDSTAFLWKRPGTNCMNQPEAHLILQILRSISDIAAPGILLKAEAIVPTAELPAYLGSEFPAKRECHLAYHSSLMAAGWLSMVEQDTALLQEVIRGTPVLPPNTSWLTYVRCHDDIGWNVLRPEASLGKQDVQQRLSAVSRFLAGEGDSYARGASFQASDPDAVHGTVGMASALTGFASAASATDMQMAARRLLLLYGLTFCFGGMPLIYMGDEFAQGNDTAYQQVAAHALDSRWLHRPLWQDTAISTTQVSNQAAQIYNSMLHLLQLRRHFPQLAADQPRQLLHCEESSVLAMLRGSAGAPLLFIANFSDQAVTLNLPELLRSGQSPAPELAQQCWHNEFNQLPADANLNIQPWSQYWLTPVPAAAA
ncbi:alpha-amylase family glycosyl hydrolase [Undibacterium griseum]|uniref:DUF3459 domain-containing protein n=1 Tax=Undibacterium griseum TaxID=2762295 RepID=A0ABR6YK17_9BURK|nr:alpha-amylase family glycosyl hydrolase [Undibacterium griseum]MBC3884242.1 DUF3459 domain-containing protein [Undibacterium griseum]